MALAGALSACADCGQRRRVDPEGAGVAGEGSDPGSTDRTDLGTIERHVRGMAVADQTVASQAEPSGSATLSIWVESIIASRLLGERARASELVDRALSRFGEHPALLTYRGNLARDSGHPETGRTDLDAALRLAPADAWVHYHSSALRLDTEEWVEAEQLARRALELDEATRAGAAPPLYQARNVLATALRRQGRYEEALAESARATREAADAQEPFVPSYWFQMARLAAQLRQWEVAHGALGELLATLDRQLTTPGLLPATVPRSGFVYMRARALELRGMATLAAGRDLASVLADFDASVLSIADQDSEGRQTATFLLTQAAGLVGFGHADEAWARVSRIDARWRQAPNVLEIAWIAAVHGGHAQDALAEAEALSATQPERVEATFPADREILAVALREPEPSREARWDRALGDRSEAVHRAWEHFVAGRFEAVLAQLPDGGGSGEPRDTTERVERLYRDLATQLIAQREEVRNSSVQFADGD